VDGVALSDVPLIEGSMSNSGFFVEGAPEGEHKRGEAPSSMEATVGQDFLAVMGIPVVAGRGFTQQDADGTPQVSVVNRTLAKKFFPNQNPIGKRFNFSKA
jgi:hypothetical protein